MDEAAAASVAAFLKRRTFFCKFLRALLTSEQCEARQGREIKRVAYGRKITLNNTPLDRYCRSGECEQGKEQLVKLKRRRRA